MGRTGVAGTGDDDDDEALRDQGLDASMSSAVGKERGAVGSEEGRSVCESGLRFEEEKWKRWEDDGRVSDVVAGATREKERKW
jgi:hypothetical protein